ncbi:hypothetical protein [Thermomonas brevis]
MDIPRADPAAHFAHRLSLCDAKHLILVRAPDVSRKRAHFHYLIEIETPRGFWSRYHA